MLDLHCQFARIVNLLDATGWVAGHDRDMNLWPWSLSV